MVMEDDDVTIIKLGSLLMPPFRAWCARITNFSDKADLLTEVMHHGRFDLLLEVS